MCEYQELRCGGVTADTRQEMNGQQLKSLVEHGHYHPQPERIAQAMLRRRGVRELLIGGGSLRPAGRIQSARESRRQAA
jgi:hypothetical protein